jgi:dolichyl-phosphate-mannose--protein O-mannosyl transferase
MEQTERSETSAYKLQMPGNYPKESIQQNVTSYPYNKRQAYKIMFSTYIML